MTFWTDIAPFAAIKKWAERVQIGRAVMNSGGYYPPRGGDFPDDMNGPGWAFRDSQVMVQASEGNMAITGVTRTSDDPVTNGDGQVSGHAAIAVSSFLINDKPGGRGWAAYEEVQHEAGATWSTGRETAIKNKGANVTHTPYSIPEGVTGWWVQGGADPYVGGQAVNPAAAIMTAVRNPGTPVGTFNAGLVFAEDVLTGAYGVVLAMAQGHQLVWYTPGNGVGASIRSDNATPGHKVQMVFVEDGVNFHGDNGQIIFSVKHVPGGVNQIMFKNGAAGTPPSLGATGPDANIDLKLEPKGTGRVRFGTYQSHADAPVTGYIEVKDASGVVRKLAVIS